MVKKRMAIKNLAVKCDAPECSWRLEILPEEFADWHNKVCPACGHGPIINDDDMRAFVGLKILVAIDEIIDPAGTMPRKTMYFDTAKLRRG